jgi:N-acetyl-anhydromuramyl-L-alanine amidase AmpD
MATSDGWCPFATRREITDSGNFDTGRKGQVVKAVVLHIGEGPLTAFFHTFKNPERKASSHFTVGKKGEIEQYVSINDTAYANGLRWDDGIWRNPRGLEVTPAWKGLIPAVNPNLYTISIEHEGFFGEAWTEPMYLAELKLLQWLRGETNLVYARDETLIGHRDFDNIDRPNCPGPNAPFDRLIADLNGGDARRTAFIAGANQLGVALNDQSALAKFALQNNLGVPLSDEFQFNVGDIPYLGQVWSQAVVYVKIGDWGNVRRT